MDKANGYRVDYPKGWKASPYISGIVVAEINKADKSTGFQIRITESGLSSIAYSEWYLGRLIKDMKAEFLSAKHLSINGMPAIEYALKSGRGPTPYFLKSWLIFVPTSNKIYIIQSGCLMNERSTIDPILSDMAESFRLN